MTQKVKTHKFELVMAVRDKNGNPTGKWRTPVKSDDSAIVANAWERNNGQFWEDAEGNHPDTNKPFLMAEIATVSRHNKKKVSNDQSIKNILLKRLQKARKSNAITDKTFWAVEDVINAISDMIRVKVRVITSNSGVVTLEFNSYEEGEQSLEINILNGEAGYNFWNGVTADQEYSDFTKLDRVKIRKLVEKFNSGLKR